MSVATGASLLTSPVRRLVMDTLAIHGALTAAEVGARLDLHVTTARFHLDQLVGGGLVESRFEKQRGAGRPKKVYAVAPGSLRDERRDAAGMAILAGLLAQTFAATGNGELPTPIEAGRAWAHENVPASAVPPADSPGRWLGKVGEMTDLLREWGYFPAVTTTDAGRTAIVMLDHCPFLALAKQNPAVVCGIHRGLIAGAMEQLGEPQATVSLEPFVGPNLCRAHVHTDTPFPTVRSTSEASS